MKTSKILFSLGVKLYFPSTVSHADEIFLRIFKLHVTSGISYIVKHWKHNYLGKDGVVVDFCGRRDIALSVNGPLSKLRKTSGRQQETWSRSRSQETKFPRTKEDCGKLDITSKFTKLDQIKTCPARAWNTRIRHEHCYFCSDISSCLEFFLLKIGHLDWSNRCLISWVFSLPFWWRFLQEKVHTAQSCRWLLV